MLAAFLLAFLLASAPAAPAAVGDFSLKQCISIDGTNGACDDGGSRQEFPFDGEASPDGRHVYQAAGVNGGGNVRIFDRDPATGLLTPRPGSLDCYSVAGFGGACTVVNTMSRPLDVLVSPDGEHVYVAAWSSSAVTVFDRDPATGRLTRKAGAAGCVAAGGAGGCRPGFALSAVLSLAMSPDGRNVYATAQSEGGSIAILRVLPDGSLEQAAGIDGCVTETGSDGLGNTCADATAIGSGYDLAISPDGRHVYAPGRSSKAITIFNRDQQTGELTQKNGLAGCISQNGFPDGSAAPRCRAQSQLEEPFATLISPDGNFVYALGNHFSNGSIVVFKRAENGLLAFQSCINELGGQGCADGRGVNGLQSGAISPDGKALVAKNLLGGGVGGLSFFDIGADGNLTQRPGVQGCATADGSIPTGASQCQVLPAAGGEGHVEFADNASILYASFGGHALSVIDRDLGPVCQPVSASTGPTSAVGVGLSCSDPNGDPISYEIVKGPNGGALGSVDQTAARVFYNPFPGFLGTDSFEYRGTARGVSSAPATAGLSVVGRPFTGQSPLPPPRPLPLSRIGARVLASWKSGRTATTLLRLRAVKVPAGASIEVRCSGKGCPFKRRAMSARKGGSIDLLGLFGRAKNLKAGLTIEVRITQAEAIGTVVRYAIRRGKAPKAQTLCMPPGAARPTAC
ncbi:MAG TPA: beta-propeller fold lactonase family protein [Solirubrobacterales bacterium]|nr:beta-propeller fold lactonase family protein [Solirubrobacterales bacterium]